MSEFRAYAAHELDTDGYPPEWHATIKHAVRAQAGHRCIRCGHPYRSGEHGNGEWSPCDEYCAHAGPFRWRLDEYDPWHSDAEPYEPVCEIEARWRILTVHHLDGDKANCRWWNLVALCQRCHLTIQGRVVMERRWRYEHTDWFRPYVAGYYALTFLGEHLSREEVDARLGELLALEDRQLALGAEA